MKALVFTPSDNSRVIPMEMLEKMEKLYGAGITHNINPAGQLVDDAWRWSNDRCVSLGQTRWKKSWPRAICAWGSRLCDPKRSFPRGERRRQRSFDVWNQQSTDLAYFGARRITGPVSATKKKTLPVSYLCDVSYGLRFTARVPTPLGSAL